METAEEFFEGVRAAHRLLAGADARLEAMRSREGVRAQRYDVGGPRRAGDAMRAVDERIDAERRVMAEARALSREIERGREVCAGIRGANRGHPLWADAVELRYCDDTAWTGVAAALDVSVSTAMRASRLALEWVDSVGVARACSGSGSAGR